MPKANSEFTQRKILQQLGIDTSKLKNYSDCYIGLNIFTQNKNKFKGTFVLVPQSIIEKAQIASLFLKRNLIECEDIKP
jgi:hypothetical protein